MVVGIDSFRVMPNKRFCKEMTSQYTLHTVQSDVFCCLWLDDPNLATCWNDVRNHIRVNRNRIGHVTWTDQWRGNDSNTHRRAADRCLGQRDGAGSHARHRGNDRHFFSPNLLWWFLGLLHIFFWGICLCWCRVACFGRNILWFGGTWLTERWFNELVSEPLATNLE